MDRNAEVLAQIIKEMTGGMEDSRKARAIAEKISQGKATYADALEYAQESGRIMNGSLRKNLPKALTDGKLYRADADVVVRKPMERSGKQVAEVAAEIQQRMNEEAGIGIHAITPEVNEDQITGIITDICNAESYDAGKEKLFTQTENFLEGTVDDCVRENADFQYKAGLSPKIERRTVGKCCEWCGRLAGTYDYADVSDKGNDVFRRHKNCHCIVSYNPGDGSRRRQNAHTKRWTEQERSDRIKLSEEEGDRNFHQRYYNADLKNGLPINGKPNSISDKLDDNGSVLQRRLYGPDGKAAVDYDTDDHGESWKHPTGAHKHIFDYSSRKPKRSKHDIPFTQDELNLNADIIIPGVNYYDDR